MKRQQGFTLTELIGAIGVLVAVAVFSGGIWVLCHFISKFW